MDGLRRDMQWLNITSQQCDILDGILLLKEKNEIASPKAIIDEVAEWSKSTKMQKSNFFSQLKKLQNKGYVKKLSNASYDIDFDGIRAALEKSHKEIQDESKNLEIAIEETEEHFNNLLSKNKRLEAKFLDYDEMLDAIANMLRTSRVCYMTGFFPKMLYANSPSLINSRGGRHYANKLWERCIHDGELEVNYITHLDVKYLFGKMMKSYGNPIQCRQEIRSILDHIESLIDEHKELRIFYSDSPYGLDISMPNAEKPGEFFLSVRNKDHQGIGGVYINSSELASKFKKLFEKERGSAVDLRSPAGRAEIKKLKKKLAEVYKEYKE